MKDDLKQVPKSVSNYIQSLEERNAQLEFQLKELQRLTFGSKRERFIPENNPHQQSLPFEIEKTPTPEIEEEEITYKRKKKSHPGRMTLPDHLPVEEIILEPTEDTTGLKKIGEEITDQLELVPAKLFIKRYIRPKYIKTSGDGLESKGVIANLPNFPIEKGMAGTGLLAQIMIDKFVDHLPIHRQIERYKRDGVKLSSSTINGWQESICNLLEPLYDCLKHRVLSQGYLQVDETPLQVLDKTKKGKTHRGYHWVYHSPIEKMVLFDYRDGRGREGPQELLRDFSGYLQTDGYAVYDKFGEREDITSLNCMAHARRGFEKALDYDKVRAEYAMGMFQQLYVIERKAKEAHLNSSQRHQLRLENSLPLLNELGKWIASSYKEVLPKSAIGQAMSYCIPRWDKLMAYLHDGELEIDNNGVENSIRPVALGRKNYLFAGSSNGARRAAMMYSFLCTCKKHGINPHDWFVYVLDHIGDTKMNDLDHLLPQNFK